ncbi:MAG TPA: alanine racemase [Thermoanaerobaculia bacterium]|nr:alanine racemase [Thermoanaerobaculia bacterium]
MSSAPDTARLTVAEIDLGAFRRNLRAIGRLLPEGSRLIAVLKADGYGHGAAALARECEREEVDLVAVALLEEALELREAGISIPILILGPVPSERLADALEAGSILGIVSLEGLRDVARAAAERPLAIHLKLDSGMGRMGLIEDDLDEAARTIASVPGLRVAALYTHFANASDPDDPFTGEQLARFDRMVTRLAGQGVEAPLHHAANSAATMRRLVRAGDFVRVGLSLYGCEPLDQGSSRLDPVLRWKSGIVRLKTLPPGSAVGYGTTFRTTRTSRIATLPVGYADGYNRLLSNNGFVLVHGRRAPVVGRVSMDLVTIDVTDIPEAAFGDEVILLGRQGGEEIAAEEIAERTRTIPYEVLTSIGARVPRLVIESGPRS